MTRQAIHFFGVKPDKQNGNGRHAFAAGGR
jgi:hypothetical protein